MMSKIDDFRRERDVATRAAAEVPELHAERDGLLQQMGVLEHRVLTSEQARDEALSMVAERNQELEEHQTNAAEAFRLATSKERELRELQAQTAEAEAKMDDLLLAAERAKLKIAEVQFVVGDWGLSVRGESGRVSMEQIGVT